MRNFATLSALLLAMPVALGWLRRRRVGRPMRIPTRLLLPLVAALLGLAPAASAVTIDWVTVGDPGNACDTQSQGCFGAVAEAYRISKYEVTNAQYAEFLNAKAASDPLALYNTSMGSGLGGITRSGSSGSFTYSAIAGREDMPVNFVSFYDSLRFSNWLHNGQGGGGTETGAYTLLGGTATPSNGLTVTRNAGASIFLTSEDEWYKAAYYDALSASYFDYPTGTDVQTVCAAPGATPNTANCLNVVGDLTDVGSYTGSASPAGTFDQGGNVWEWNEAIISGSYRGLRGGTFDSIPSVLAASFRLVDFPTNESSVVGFRVASPIPEPGTGLLVMAGMLGLAGWRRRSRGRYRSILHRRDFEIRRLHAGHDGRIGGNANDGSDAQRCRRAVDRRHGRGRGRHAVRCGVRGWELHRSFFGL